LQKLNVIGRAFATGCRDHPQVDEIALGRRLSRHRDCIAAVEVIDAILTRSRRKHEPVVGRAQSWSFKPKAFCCQRTTLSTLGSASGVAAKRHTRHEVQTQPI
jgi:hypothetical protein